MYNKQIRQIQDKSFAKGPAVVCAIELKLSMVSEFDVFTSSTSKPVYVISAHTNIRIMAAISNPTMPEAKGSANIPAPIDVPIISKVQPSVLFFMLVFQIKCSLR